MGPVTRRLGTSARPTPTGRMASNAPANTSRDRTAAETIRASRARMVACPSAAAALADMPASRPALGAGGMGPAGGRAAPDPATPPSATAA
jgi:hypothetical protein